MYLGWREVRTTKEEPKKGMVWAGHYDRARSHRSNIPTIQPGAAAVFPLIKYQLVVYQCEAAMLAVPIYDSDFVGGRPSSTSGIYRTPILKMTHAPN